MNSQFNIVFEKIIVLHYDYEYANVKSKTAALIIITKTICGSYKYSLFYKEYQLS